MPEILVLRYLPREMHGACPNARNGQDLTISYNLSVLQLPVLVLRSDCIGFVEQFLQRLLNDL